MSKWSNFHFGVKYTFTIVLKDHRIVIPYLSEHSVLEWIQYIVYMYAAININVYKNVLKYHTKVCYYKYSISCGPQTLRTISLINFRLVQTNPVLWK